MPKDIFPKLSGSQKSSSSTSVFPNLFFAAPLLVLQIFSRTPMVKYKDRGIVTIGGIPVTSSRHPSVPQHPSWEPLFYLLLLKFFQKVIRRLFSSLHQKALQKGEEKKHTGITFEQFRLFSNSIFLATVNWVVLQRNWQTFVSLSSLSLDTPS